MNPYRTIAICAQVLAVLVALLFYNFSMVGLVLLLILANYGYRKAAAPKLRKRYAQADIEGHGSDLWPEVKR